MIVSPNFEKARPGTLNRFARNFANASVTQTMKRLEAGGTVMGLFDHGTYEPGRERVSAGDLLVLYSVGVTEAENPAGEEVGDDRLAAWLHQAAGKSATEVVEAVQRDLAAFCASAAARDDVTVMVVKVL